MAVRCFCGLQILRYYSLYWFSSSSISLLFKFITVLIKKKLLELRSILSPFWFPCSEKTDHCTCPRSYLLTAHSNVIISLPTFIIAECVLIYLDPDSSRTIVGWASRTFSTAIFFLYEQVVEAIKLNLGFFHELDPSYGPFNLSSTALLSYATVNVLLMYCNDLVVCNLAYYRSTQTMLLASKWFVIWRYFWLITFLMIEH